VKADLSGRLGSTKNGHKNRFPVVEKPINSKNPMVTIEAGTEGLGLPSNTNVI